jgi:hypothetical protein
MKIIVWLILACFEFFGFPSWMRKVKGNQSGWECERCGKRFADGWMIEFHHRLPTSAGGQDTFDNMSCLCQECHYNAHLDLRAKGLDHPSSAGLVKERLNRTGGRTDKWLKKNGWR